MTKVDLVAMAENDRPVLENLAQLYMYDFSEFAHGDVGPDGKFRQIDFERLYAKPALKSWLIEVDGRLAGFACACRGEAFRDPAEELWWMEEFFVMRRYRGMGVGQRVATRIFEELGGTWEVGQVSTNTGAQAFWRKVIGRYTGGDYEEFVIDDERWLGPVQYFHVQRRTDAKRASGD